MSDLLRAAGRTLESIKIEADPPLATIDEFKQIRESCPNLSSVSLKASNNKAYSAYAALLCAFGPQIQFAYLQVMPVLLCSRVVKECKNLRCTLDAAMVMPTCVSRARLFQTGVQSIYVRVLGVANEKFPLADVSMCCRRLEKMHLYVEAERAAGAIAEVFSHDLPLLSTFELDVPVSEGSDRDVGEALMEFGKHVGTIRHFEFSGLAPDKGAFANIARSAPVLQSVRLNFKDKHCGEKAAEYRARVENAVTTLLDCPALRELRHADSSWWERPLEASEAIANKCRQLQLAKKPDLNIKVLRVIY